MAAGRGLVVRLEGHRWHSHSIGVYSICRSVGTATASAAGAGAGACGGSAAITMLQRRLLKVTLWIAPTL